MDSLFWQRTKIPNVLGVLILVVIMGGLVLASSNLGTVKNFFTSASVGSAPSGQVGIANVSDSSFTAFWTTEDEAGGAVFYGKSPGLGDGVAVDDRDLTSPNGKYLTHLVRVAGLEAETKYYFKIGVSEPSYGDSSNGQAPFEIVTGKAVANSSSVEPIFGVANTVSGPAEGAIVTWDAPGASKLATLAKTDGSFVLPVGTARTSPLDDYFPIKVGQIEKIVITAEADTFGTIQCTYGSDKPLPTVKIGESVDCARKNAPQNTARPASPSATNIARFKVPPAKTTPPPIRVSPSGNAQLNIVSGQTVSTPFPTISGKVKPKQLVKIVIHSETPYSGTVIAGPDGNWSWTPPAGLTPGEHTVTITIVNSDGTTQTITRSFTVSVDNPLLPITSGTPSAQTTHLACEGSACKAVIGSGIDSCSFDSDCVTPITTPPPTPAPTQPYVTGARENTALVLGLGLVFIALSGALILKDQQKHFSN